MANKKLQVFVSSTYTDLIVERQAAVEAILSAGHIPAGMELFAASDESQMTVIKRWIDDSDVYMLILGGRYGSVEGNSGKSYTHLEYEYALQKEKPLFAVVINDAALEEKIKREGGGVVEKDHGLLLKGFRQIACSNLVKFWADKKDIQLAVYQTLGELSSREELVGWVRGDNAVNGGLLAGEIARLTKENSNLRSQIGSQSSNSGALYGGLTYPEAEQLLKSYTYKVSDKEMSLFDILLNEGHGLIEDWRGYPPNDKVQGQLLPAMRQAVFFKLLFANGTIQFRLTPDGHNFYIKSLLMKSLSEDFKPIVI